MVSGTSKSQFIRGEMTWIYKQLLTSKLSWKSIVMQLLLISSSIVLGIYHRDIWTAIYYRKLLIIHTGIKHDVYQTTEPSGIQQYNLGKRPWHKVSHMTFQSMAWIDPYISRSVCVHAREADILTVLLYKCGMCKSKV